MTTKHPRRALAEAEAAAWADLHKGWDRGLPAEARGALGGQLRTRTSHAQRQREADAQERLDATEVATRPASEWTPSAAQRREAWGGGALGLSPWARGWERRLHTEAPSPDAEDSAARAAWRRDVAPRLLTAPVQLTADNTVDHGDWWPAQLTPAQLATRQLVAASRKPLPRLDRVERCLPPKAPEPSRVVPAHLVQRPVRRLGEVTWTLGRPERLPADRKRSDRLPVGLWEEADRVAAEEPEDAAGQLAAAELAAWCDARLTARQLECLVAEDQGDPTVRSTRRHAREMVQRELPARLRLRR